MLIKYIKSLIKPKSLWSKEVQEMIDDLEKQKVNMKTIKQNKKIKAVISNKRTYRSSPRVNMDDDMIILQLILRKTDYYCLLDILDTEV